MRANAGSADKPDDIQGKPQPIPGKYHVVITECNDSRKKRDGSAFNNTVFQLEVLAGTVPGQEGKEMPLFARLGDDGEETEEYCGVISRLAMACGILKPRESKELSAEDFINQQFVVGWEGYIGKDKKEHFSVANFGLATWGVNDEAVRDVPKNLAAIKLWREATSGSNGNGQQPPKTQPGSDVDDLL